jgi:hypothetical protein
VHLLQLHVPKSVTNTIPPLDAAGPAQRAGPTYLELEILVDHFGFVAKTSDRRPTNSR